MASLIFGKVILSSSRITLRCGTDSLSQSRNSITPFNISIRECRGSFTLNTATLIHSERSKDLFATNRFPPIRALIYCDLAKKDSCFFLVRINLLLAANLQTITMQTISGKDQLKVEIFLQSANWKSGSTNLLPKNSRV